MRWGHERGPLLRKLFDAFASLRLGSWCVRKLRPLDHRLLSRSNGRYTVAGPMGVPLLLLTTTGKKSGQRRQTPLLYQREGDRLFLIGSNFGQSMHPAWSSNLLADPNAWVTMGGGKYPSSQRGLRSGIRPRLHEVCRVRPEGRSGLHRPN